MKITITSRLVGTLILVSIIGTGLFLPFVPVIQGRQPVFYKAPPCNYCFTAGEEERMAEYLKTYRFAHRTFDQEVLAIVRGIEIFGSLLFMFIRLIIYSIDLKNGRKTFPAKQINIPISFNFNGTRRSKELRELMREYGTTDPETPRSHDLYHNIKSRGGWDS